MCSFEYIFVSAQRFKVSCNHFCECKYVVCNLYVHAIIHSSLQSARPRLLMTDKLWLQRHISAEGQMGQKWKINLMQSLHKICWSTCISTLIYYFKAMLKIFRLCLQKSLLTDSTVCNQNENIHRVIMCSIYVVINGRIFLINIICLLCS